MQKPPDPLAVTAVALQGVPQAPAEAHIKDLHFVVGHDSRGDVLQGQRFVQKDVFAPDREGSLRWLDQEDFHRQPQVSMLRLFLLRRFRDLFVFVLLR